MAASAYVRELSAAISASNAQLCANLLSLHTAHATRLVSVTSSQAEAATRGDLDGFGDIACAHMRAVAALHAANNAEAFKMQCVAFETFIKIFADMKVCQNGRESLRCSCSCCSCCSSPGDTVLL